MVAVPVALRNRGEGKKPEYNGTDKANSMTTVQTDSMVEIDFKIRKLTPIECERLQGVPDDYTKYGGEQKAKDILEKNPEHHKAFTTISNNQRYKTLGNAFNVDVISWILCFI